MLNPAQATHRQSSDRNRSLDWNQTTAIRRMVEHRWFAVVMALVLTGLGAASAALLFKGGLDLLGRGRLRLIGLGPDLLLLPMIVSGGGFLSGLLVERLAPAAQGSGVPQVMRFLRRRAVPMGVQLAVIKLIAGIVAIGSGFPLGPSGPSIQMGSSVGWEIGRRLRAPKAFLRMIVAAGGGAGIAAVFRAPIGGFLYTLEELLQGARPLVMLLVLVTTFWADTWADLLGLAGLSGLGDLRSPHAGWVPGGRLRLERQVDAYVEVLPIDLVILFGIGAVVAVAAEAYCRYVARLNAMRIRLGISLSAGMAAAGLLIGLTDALLPGDFINRAAIRQAVAEGQVSISRALAIFLVLFLTTGLAAAAGTPGGLFAPMLTLGGALGVAAAEVIERLGGSAPNTVVFAGMGAFMTACARAPISATFLTFAVTKDLLILKPILVACLGAYIAARLLHPHSIFKRVMPPEAPGEIPPEDRPGLSLPTVPLRPRKLQASGPTEERRSNQRPPSSGLH